MLTNYVNSLRDNERRMVRSITRLDREIGLFGRKLVDTAQKITRLVQKYVSVFRMRNPDLRHFKA